MVRRSKQPECPMTGTSYFLLCVKGISSSERSLGKLHLTKGYVFNGACGILRSQGNNYLGEPRRPLIAYESLILGFLG
jgi:hypothetical protein